MNKVQSDGIAILLASRHYLYKLLQHTFGNEPSPQLLEAVTCDHTRDALRLWLEEDESALSDNLTLLNDMKAGLVKHGEKILDQLKSEYTFLFIGPNKLPAPPWESVYLSDERTIFQESTLRVRKAYLEYGFLPSNYPHEADDHLAMELDFMVHLSKLALEQFEEKSYESVLKILSSQKSFLEEHLLMWIKDFSREIQNSRTKYFYPQLAALTEKVLLKDKAVVQEIISAI